VHKLLEKWSDLGKGVVLTVDSSISLAGVEHLDVTVRKTSHQK